MTSTKRVVLNFQQRLNILKELEASSIPCLAEKYNVHPTTIRRIKEKAAIIAEFAAKDMKEKRRQRIRKPTYGELEQRLFTWFVEKRNMEESISDAMLLEKAAELKAEIAGCASFKVSKSWLANFKRRQGIRLVRVYNEKASPDEEEAKLFVSEFQKMIEEEQIDPENIYNMDESGLLWKPLPMRTLVDDNEKSVNGHRMQKESVTVWLCSNATGTHKIKPPLIYQYKKPKALKNCTSQLPVIFKKENNAWMDQILFVDWFQNDFKKAVKKYQLEKGLCGKVILLIESCAGHNFPSDFIHDENIVVRYLPASTTSLIQPMNQGIIEKTKMNFRHKMTQHLVNYSGAVHDFYKNYTMEDGIELINKAWDDVTCRDIRDAWKKLLPQMQSKDEENSKQKEMEETFTCIPQPNVPNEDIKDYLTVCTKEEKEIPHTDENMHDDRDDDYYNDDDEDEDGDEEKKVKMDEIREREDRVRECGINLNEEERMDIEDIFKRLESYKNRIPRSAQLHVEGIKLLFLVYRALSRDRTWLQKI